ncbi:MAG: hypothetical protein IK094_02235 [Treponema sp.]|nr:hypothetical protein [Treponema sp.]
MKRNAYIFLAFAALFLLPIFSAGAELSPLAQKSVDDFMALRMKIAGLGPDKALAQVADFEKKLSVDSTFRDEEDRLVLVNFIVMEKYNFLRKEKGTKEQLKKLLKELKERNEAWFDKHSEEEAGKWLLATSADVTSCYMSYSLSEVIKSGMSLRDRYKESVEKNPDFSYGWNNLGQWYYWAPAINGGSDKKAGEAFEAAVKSAKTKAEKFFACVFYSQFMFEEKDFKKAASLLDEAEAQDPGNPYIAFMRKINAGGDSFFDWNKKNSQMDNDKKK